MSRWKTARRRLRKWFESRQNPKTLFVFGGPSQLSSNAGAELAAHDTSVLATVQDCDALLQQWGEPRVLHYFNGDPAENSFSTESEHLCYTTVLHLASISLWRSRGVQPETTLGAGLGEIAAAHAAGGLTLETALRLAVVWARASRLHSSQYRLLSVDATEAEASDWAVDSPVPLFLVAVFPRRCLLICAEESADRVQVLLTESKFRGEILPVIWPAPYHTRLLANDEVLLDQLRDIPLRPLARPCFLSSLGRMAPVGTVLGPEHWTNVMRGPVRLRAVKQALRTAGHFLTIPVAPAPFEDLGENVFKWKNDISRPLVAPKRSEWETFLATHRALAARKKTKPSAETEPSLRLPDFLQSFTTKVTNFEHPSVPLAYLRQAGEMHFVPPDGGWLVLDAKLIRTVLGNPQLFSSSINKYQNPELLGADPPVHGQVRSLLQSFFAPSALSALSAFAEIMIERLGTAARNRTKFDFVADFALPLTSAVSGKLIGFSETEAQELIRRLPQPIYSGQYGQELDRYLAEYYDRRQTSDPPVMADRIAAYVETGEFTKDNAVSLTKIMWEAGVLTTSSALGHTTLYLLTHPEMAERLRLDPGLIDAFIEEMLRLDPIVNAVHRITTQPVRLGDHDLPAGMKVLCCATAANRDSAVYPRPDEVDLHRDPTRHLTFSSGVHGCLGAYLARLEVRLVINWILEQGSGLRLAEPFSPPLYFPFESLRVLAALPLRLK